MDKYGNNVNIIAEKKIVHSKQLLTLQGNKPLPLLVISPNHGKVNYRWEQRFSDLDEWKIFDVPLWTCLLYVECARQYRCTVEDKCVVFHVKGILMEHAYRLKSDVLYLRRFC